MSTILVTNVVREEGEALTGTAHMLHCAIMSYMRENSLQRFMFLEYIDFDAFPEQQQLIFCYVSPYEKNKIPEVVRHFNGMRFRGVATKWSITNARDIAPDNPTYRNRTKPKLNVYPTTSHQACAYHQVEDDVEDDESDEEINPSPNTTMIQSIASAVEEIKIQTTVLSTNAQYTNRRVEQLRGYSDTFDRFFDPNNRRMTIETLINELLETRQQTMKRSASSSNELNPKKK